MVRVVGCLGGGWLCVVSCCLYRSFCQSVSGSVSRPLSHGVSPSSEWGVCESVRPSFCQSGWFETASEPRPALLPEQRNPKCVRRTLDPPIQWAFSTSYPRLEDTFPCSLFHPWRSYWTSWTWISLIDLLVVLLGVCFYRITLDSIL